ncbi:hypothetical protein ES708_23909 [subsurface metagenome]
MAGEYTPLIDDNLGCNRLLFGACRSYRAGDGDGCAWSDFRWGDRWPGKAKVYFLLRRLAYIIDVIPLALFDQLAGNVYLNLNVSPVYAAGDGGAREVKGF